MEVRELLEGETRLAHEAMRALRPAYAAEADFVARVDGIQRADGYRLALPAGWMAQAQAGLFAAA